MVNLGGQKRVQISYTCPLVVTAKVERNKTDIA